MKFFFELDNIFDELISCGAEVNNVTMRIALLKAIPVKLNHITHVLYSQPHLSYLATCDSLKGHMELFDSLEESSVHLVKTGPTQKYHNFAIIARGLVILLIIASKL